MNPVKHPANNQYAIPFFWYLLDTKCQKNPMGIQTTEPNAKNGGAIANVESIDWPMDPIILPPFKID
jgi:hypothetical protein